MFGESHAFDPSFRERMDDAQEAARTRLESRAYLGARVTRARPALRLWWTLADLCAYLGIPEKPVSPARAKFLLGTGRVKGASRAGTGKGSPWRLPAYRQPDGSYKPTISQGKRGPSLGVIGSRASNLPF